MSDQSQSGSNIVSIGGRQFAASCLTLGVIRRNVAALKTVVEMRARSGEGEDRDLPTTEQFDAVITIVGQSLTPINAEQNFSFSGFVDTLDFRTAIVELLAALRKIMELSGYKAAEASSESGEAPRAASST